MGRTRTRELAEPYPGNASYEFRRDIGTDGRNCRHYPSLHRAARDARGSRRGCASFGGCVIPSLRLLAYVELSASGQCPQVCAHSSREYDSGIGCLGVGYAAGIDVRKGGDAMKTDPVIGAIRRIRSVISREYGHDHVKIVEYLKGLESRYRVRRPKRKIISRNAAARA